MLYKFKLGYNAAEATKKSKGAVDHSMVRVAKPSMQEPKIVDFEAVLQAIEINVASTTWRVSSDISILQFSVVCHFHVIDKSLQNC